MLIASALAKFQQHLLENLGQPIGLATIAAFSELVKDLMSAVLGGSE